MLSIEANASSSLDQAGISSPETTQVSFESPVEITSRISPKFRNRTSIRVIESTHRVSQFSTDSEGNVYATREYPDDSPLNVLWTLQTGSSQWSPTGARVHNPTTHTSLVDPRFRDLTPLLFLSAGGDDSGYFYNSRDGLAPLSLLCTHAASGDFFGGRCQRFSGAQTQQVVLDRSSGDMYIRNNEGMYLASQERNFRDRVRIGNQATKLFAGVNTVYAEGLGTKYIYKYVSGSFWSKISDPVIDFVSSIDGVLFKADSLGIYQYVGGERGWFKIGDKTSLFGFDTQLVVGYAKDLYAVDKDGGHIYRYSGVPGSWDLFYGPSAEEVQANRKSLVIKASVTGKPELLVELAHPNTLGNEIPVSSEDILSAPVSGLAGFVLLGLGFLGILRSRH